MVRRALIEQIKDKTEEVVQALNARYKPPTWAFFAQVRNATGFPRQARTADAIAMALWPSRGLELNGFEIKVHRADWLREFHDPAKADEIYKFCDRWWLVVGEENIVQKGELPGTWGLMVLRGAMQLRVEVDAPKLEPVSLDKAFVAAVFRRAAEVVTPAAKLKQEYQRGYDAARKDKSEDRDYELSSARRELEDMRKMVSTFQQASGVTISQWKAGKIGEAVRQVLAGPQWLGQLRRMREIAADIVKEADEFEKGIPAAQLAEVDTL